MIIIMNPYDLGKYYHKQNNENKINGYVLIFYGM